MSLKSSKTDNHLKQVSACELQASRRVLYFAVKADIEGYKRVAGVFCATAEAETGSVHGHLEKRLLPLLLVSFA